MQRTAALRLAGPTARLVARPTGVAHVYTGPLTPSGCCVPRSRRTVCRAHTRRLYVVPPASDDPGTGRGICARCSACLAATPRAVRQAEPQTREEYAAAYAAVTLDDLERDAAAAGTPADIDHVAHLSLLLFGHHACSSTGLTKRIAQHRDRVNGITETETARRIGEAATHAHANRKAEIKNAWQEREDRIARLGIKNATRQSTNRSELS